MNISPYDSPCKGCTSRTVEPNCHTDCPAYLAFRAKIDADLAKRYAKIDLDAYTEKRVNRIRKASLHTWKPYRSRMN